MQTLAQKCTLLSFFFTSLLFMSSINLSTSAKLCNPNDEKALLEIKHHFHNPTAFGNWDPNTDCCKDWSGIQGCDAHGRVLAMDISSNGLTGSIPPSLAQLHKLNTLFLSSNNLSGPIPSFLGYMKNLQGLYLYDNKLSGAIPPSLALLPKLSDLNLGMNLLTGSIPNSFGSFKTRSLSSLSLNSNKLSGPIPRSLGKINITTINLNDNKFTGDGSNLFSRDNMALFSIDISSNLFKFDFSKAFLSQKLVYLNISHNVIYGSLPKNLGQLPLQRIDVSFNQLCGKIPTGRRLKQFSPALFSHNKCLCGPPLPPCY